MMALVGVKHNSSWLLTTDIMKAPFIKQALLFGFSILVEEFYSVTTGEGITVVDVCWFVRVAQIASGLGS